MAEEHSKSGGKWEEMKGKAKKAMGDVREDPEQRREGRLQEDVGEGKQARSEMERERRDRT